MSSTLRSGDAFAGYQIVRPIGAGGMGAVYQARDRDLPRFVALKLLTVPGGGGPDQVRFRREADAVARLDHPNIVTVYARGEQGDQLWIAMTYVDGHDVSTALRRGAMNPARAVRIISETAAALDHAHAAGILHRDVKPANILLTHGPPERVLLTDFGIAKAMDESCQLTRAGEVVASFHYAAPERWTQPDAADHRADVYSLGCTLHHMLTGQLPYPGQSVGQLLYGHAYGEIPQPSRQVPTLPRGFDDVIARAMAKDPGHRFENCTQLAWAAAQILRQPTAPGVRTHTGNTQYLGGRTGSLSPRDTTRTRNQPPRPPVPTRTERNPATQLPPPTRPAHTSGPLPAPTPAPTRLDTSLRRDPPSNPEPVPPVRNRRDKPLWILPLLALLVVLTSVAYLQLRGDGSDTAQPPTTPAPAASTAPSIITATTTTVATSEPAPTTDSPIITTRKTTDGGGPVKEVTIQVPKVVGTLITAAKVQLQNAGFTVVEVSRKDTTPKGTVVAVDPAEGATRPTGSSITVYVSTGPTTTTLTMPNLVGLTPTAATAALAKAGWTGKLQQSTVKVTDPTAVGTVITQSQSAGTSITPDAALSVTVGEKAAVPPSSTDPKTQPTPTG